MKPLPQRRSSLPTEGSQPDHDTRADPAPLPHKISVILVDDHQVFREQLANLIEKAGDMTVSAQTDNVREGFALIQQMQPTIAIVDLTLKSSTGLELLKKIRGHGIDVPVLILSMHDESLYAERALRAGARAYVTKSKASENLLVTIREVLKS
jgi:DNA-binding NarL/FixJ family response regulator